MEGYHEPVLLREVLGALDVREGSWYLDATLGDGGHSLEVLKRGGRVIGIDVDPEAIERAKGRLGKLGRSGDFIAVQGNFRNLKNLILRQAQDKYTQADLVDQKFAGVIFDLGVSSLQLENPERGFSFSKSGPLDMRMDPTLQVRALDLVNGLNRGELNELFSKLGEEKYSRAISDALVSAREVAPVKTTRQLVDIVENVTGRKRGLPAGRQGKIHPATRIFQALRIAVNDELNALKEALPESWEVTKNHGLILVISFHSLEDRIVKNTFKKWQAERLGQVLTRKPITPGLDEIRDNRRSRSAKLRIFKVVRNDNYKQSLKLS